MLAAREASAARRIVVIDPRRTATADECDLHLALDARHGRAAVQRAARPSGAQRARRRATSCRDSTSGFDAAAALADADAPSIARVAGRLRARRPPTSLRSTTCSPRTERTVTVFCQGVNQSAHGTDKVNAIINCHLATGRIGKPGMGPFSITGQPNAMGGREVGGLANQLAAHMDFDNPADIDRVARFWDAPGIAAARRPQGGRHVPGRRRWPDQGALDHGHQSRRQHARCHACARRACADLRFRRRLRRARRTDTTRYADVLLPAAALGREGRHRHQFGALHLAPAAVPAGPGEARPDWWIVCEVGRRMGLCRGLRLSIAGRDLPRACRAFGLRERRETRLFDIGGLAALTDVRTTTPSSRATGRLRTGARRTQGCLADGRFPTPDGRARLVPVRQEGTALHRRRRLSDRAQHRPPARPVAHHDAHRQRAAPDGQCTGAHGRSQSGRRGGLSLEDGDLAHLSTRYGLARAKVRMTDASGAARLSCRCIGAALSQPTRPPARLSAPMTDPHSGQPELKHVPVRIGTRDRRLGRRPDHAARSPADRLRPLEPRGGRGRLGLRTRRYRNAGSGHPAGAQAAGRLPARSVAGIHRPATASPIARQPSTRAAPWPRPCWSPPQGMLPARDWLMSLLAIASAAVGADRRALLSGRSPVPDAAGRAHRLLLLQRRRQSARFRRRRRMRQRSTQSASTLRAGTNCGSCRSEIKTIIDAGRIQAAE